MKNIPQKVRSIHETYGCPIYSLEEYCEQILHMKKSDLNNIEVCYQLPNFDDSFIAEDIENLNADEYCLVLDEYSVFLMPNKITMKEYQQNNKKNGTPDHFYKVFTTPKANAGTGVLYKDFTSLNNAVIAGNNNVLDVTGYFLVKEYSLSSGQRAVIGGNDFTDTGIIVWDSRMSFECNLDKTYKGLETDEWEAACLWDQTGLSGVEYNFCVDSGINECAIYKMEMDPETDEMETDSNTFEPYEIDFDDPHWEDELRAAMTTAHSHFFLAEERTQSQAQTL